MRKLLLLGGLIFLVLTLASWQIKKSIKGDKNIVKKEFSISDYDKINLSGSNTIVYLQKLGAAPYVAIEIDQNLVDLLDVTVKNKELQITTKDRVSVNPSKFVVYTNSKELSTVEVRGSGKFVAEGIVQAKELKISIGGSGKCEFNNLEAHNVKGSISGSGKIILGGKGTTSDFSISGSGSIDAKDLSVDDVNASISGSGSMTVAPKNKLNARISGSGKIKYTGSPEVDKKVSGSGSIKQL